MKQRKRLMAAGVGVLGLFLFLAAVTPAPEACPREDDEVAAKYIGVRTCKKCHNKSSTGKQYKVWSSKKHASAYEILKTERSKEVAKEAGVEGNPWEAKECLICHTTAFGLDKKAYGDKFSVEDGVACEACHGAGEHFAKPADGKLHKEAHGKGYVTPDEALCRTCHNETSPTWDPERDTTKDGKKVGFDFEKRWKMILHPIKPPKKEKEEKDKK